MDKRLAAAKAQVEKDPNCHATTPEDELEAALDVHGTCVRALDQLDPEIRQQVLESVARFHVIPVEPSVGELANLLMQTAGAALQIYRGSQPPAVQEVSPDPGTEGIASLLVKMMRRFPAEQAQKLHDFVAGLLQEAYEPGPSSSSEVSSGEPSSE